MFELINDIQQNCADFQAHAPPIDWSGLGGVPWLLGMVVALLVGVVLAMLVGAATARERARWKLYDLAEAEGRLRAARRDERGYAEY